MPSSVKVAVLMGSDSDLPVMSKASEVLTRFRVPHLMTVASAHRSPRFLATQVHQALKKGAQVFIAGAGGAAHLAGTVAALATRPVIGVPLSSKLQGLDSLLATVQMPKGVPVATVAVDGAENAAYLAIQILALQDARLAKRMAAFKEEMAREVIHKAQRLAVHHRKTGTMKMRTEFEPKDLK